MSSQDPAVTEWHEALNPFTEAWRLVAEQQAALAAALEPATRRWSAVWAEVFHEMCAYQAFISDPDADPELIEAVERAYEVTHA